MWLNQNFECSILPMANFNGILGGLLAMPYMLSFDTISDTLLYSIALHKRRLSAIAANSREYMLPSSLNEIAEVILSPASYISDWLWPDSPPKVKCMAYEPRGCTAIHKEMNP